MAPCRILRMVTSFLAPRGNSLQFLLNYDPFPVLMTKLRHHIFFSAGSCVGGRCASCGCGLCPRRRVRCATYQVVSVLSQFFSISHRPIHLCWCGPHIPRYFRAELCVGCHTCNSSVADSVSPNQGSLGLARPRPLM